MLINHKEGSVVDAVQNVGMLDYIDENGDLHVDEKPAAVLIRTGNDLALVSDYPVGTIAYTAGFAKIWQKGANGTWTEV